MATATPIPASPEVDDYPCSDGKPMGETQVHGLNLMVSVQTLRHHYAADPMVYVWGNMFVHYVRGDRRKHLAPDVFVALGVPDRVRDSYKVWEEGKAPDLVIEMTSPSTKEEDLEQKIAIYRDKMGVREYFLFDPKDEYLQPPLQGYRLIDGQYVPIEPIEGRLPSEVLGLHLERDGSLLRFYDPRTGLWLPTPEEIRAALEATEATLEQTEATLEQTEATLEQTEATLEQTEATLEQTEAARQQTEAARQQAEAARQQAEAALEQAEAALEQTEAARQQAEAARLQAETARQDSDTERQELARALHEAEAVRREAEADAARLRAEIEAMRRHPAGGT